jgi:hypothetical protein
MKKGTVKDTKKTKKRHKRGYNIILCMVKKTFKCLKNLPVHTFITRLVPKKN